MAGGGVPQAQLLDLLATTLAKRPANEYRNLLLGQSYIAQLFMKEMKVKDMSGTGVTFSAIIMGDTGDTGAEGTDGPGVYGPYGVLPGKATNYQAQGAAPWSYYQGYWILSSQEIALNKGKEGFIDITKSTLEGGMTRFVNMLETHFWSRSGYLHMLDAAPWIIGPEYWITDDGFAINDPAGANGTLVGGISPTNAAYNDAAGRNRWRNQFLSVTNVAELPDALDDLFVECRFKAPPNVALNTEPQFKRQKIVLDKNSFKDIKALRRREKDNPVTMDNSGDPVINNTKLEMADRMAARTDTKGQAFFFNLATWKSFVERDHNFQRDPVRHPDNQDVRLQRWYLWPAIVCEDRRSNGKAFGWGRLAKR